jgi:hypothetical protein
MQHEATLSGLPNASPAHVGSRRFSWRAGEATRRFCLVPFALSYILVAPVDAAKAQSDLLAGIRVTTVARVSYNRARDYGGWLRMSAPYNRCFNVRDQVLADESPKSRLKFKQPVHGWRCTIIAGSWRDPYTGRRTTDPKKLDIDHVVPLKEAHLSGGHLWPKEKRILYANYLQDPKHLLAVDFSENRKKGDKDPPRYMPPDPRFHCRYLKYWVAIKRQWKLSMDRTEAAFVRQRLARC